jgi:threonine synthase
MITIQDENVHVYRTEGTSDEQASVLKELFSDKHFCAEYNICSVNSINWSRISVQSSYFVWAYLQIYNTKNDFGKSVNFCIPTGGKMTEIIYFSFFI